MYAKCISEDEYHSSKRPLLQRLAVQGAEIEARDVIIVVAQKEKSDEEWSIIDLKDEKCLLSKENSNLKIKLRQGSAAMKQIKGAASSVLSFGSSNSKTVGKSHEEEEEENVRPNDRNIIITRGRNELGLSTENPFWNSNFRDNESETKSILMPPEPMKAAEKQSGGGGGDKGKRKPFKNLFQKEQKEEDGGNENGYKSGKKQWGFDGFKKWKKADSDDETAPLASSNGKVECSSLVSIFLTLSAEISGYPFFFQFE